MSHRLLAAVEGQSAIHTARARANIYELQMDINCMKACSGKIEWASPRAPPKSLNARRRRSYGQAGRRWRTPSHGREKRNNKGCEGRARLSSLHPFDVLSMHGQAEESRSSPQHGGQRATPLIIHDDGGAPAAGVCP
jgi:hypothetical protein